MVSDVTVLALRMSAIEESLIFHGRGHTASMSVEVETIASAVIVTRPA